MVGPVTIPKVGTSWHDMYESIGLCDSPLLPKCEEEKQVHCMPVLVHASTTW